MATYAIEPPEYGASARAHTRNTGVAQKEQKQQRNLRITAEFLNKGDKVRFSAGWVLRYPCRSFDRSIW